jgi:hypothetical protein
MKHYMEMMFSKMDFSLQQSYTNAEKKLFGVEKAKLPLKLLDEAEVRRVLPMPCCAGCVILLK